MSYDKATQILHKSTRFESFFKRKGPQVVLNFWIPGLLTLALSTPRL